MTFISLGMHILLIRNKLVNLRNGINSQVTGEIHRMQSKSRPHFRSNIEAHNNAVIECNRGHPPIGSTFAPPIIALSYRKTAIFPRFLHHHGRVHRSDVDFTDTRSAVVLPVSVKGMKVRMEIEEGAPGGGGLSWREISPAVAYALNPTLCPGFNHHFHPIRASHQGMKQSLKGSG